MKYDHEVMTDSLLTVKYIFVAFPVNFSIKSVSISW